MSRRADFVLVDIVFGENILRFANRTLNLNTPDGIVSYVGLVSDVGKLSSGVALPEFDFTVENVGVTLRNLDNIAASLVPLTLESATARIRMFEAHKRPGKFLLDLEADLEEIFSIQGNVEDVEYDVESLKFTVTDRTREIYGEVPPNKVFNGMVGFAYGVLGTPTDGVAVVPSDIIVVETTIFQLFYVAQGGSDDPLLNDSVFASAGALRGGMVFFPKRNIDKAITVTQTATVDEGGGKQNNFTLPNTFFSDTLSVTVDSAPKVFGLDFRPYNIVTTNTVIFDLGVTLGSVVAFTYVVVSDANRPPIMVISDNKLVEVDPSYLPVLGGEISDSVTDEQLFVSVQSSDTFTGDGTTNVFTTSFSFVSATVSATINGIRQIPFLDFTVPVNTGNGISFKTAPPNNAVIVVTYTRSGAGATKLAMVEMGIINDSDSITDMAIPGSASQETVQVGARGQLAFGFTGYPASARDNIVVSMPKFDKDLSEHEEDLLRRCYQTFAIGEFPGIVGADIQSGALGMKVGFRQDMIHPNAFLPAYDPSAREVFIRITQRKGASLTTPVVVRVASISFSNESFTYNSLGYWAADVTFVTPLGSEFAQGDAFARCLNRQGQAVNMGDFYYRLKEVKSEALVSGDLLGAVDVDQNRFFDGILRIVDGTGSTRKIERVVTELRTRFEMVLGKAFPTGVEMHFGFIGGDIIGSPVLQSLTSIESGDPTIQIRAGTGFYAATDAMLKKQQFRGGVISPAINQYFENSTLSGLNFAAMVDETSEWQLVRFEVPQNSSDLGESYPIMYGQFEAFPMVHVGGLAVAAEVPAGRHQDYYLLCGHEITYNPSNLEDPTTPFRVWFDLDVPAEKRAILTDPLVVQAVQNLGLTLPTNPLSSPDFQIQNNTLDNKGNPVSVVLINGTTFGLGSSKLYADFTGINMDNPVDILADFVERFTGLKDAGFEVDTGSLGDAKSRRASYKFAVHVTKETDALDVIKAIGFQAAIVPIVKKGLLKIKSIEFDDPSPAFFLSEGVNILDESEVSLQSKTDVFSRFEVHFDYDFVGNKYQKKIEIDPDNNLEAARAERRFGKNEHDPIELAYIFDEATAQLAIDNFIVPFFTRQRAIVKLSTVKDGLEGLEEMDVVAVTHSVGAEIEGKGWNRKLFWVVEIAESPVRYDLTLMSVEENPKD